VKKTLEEKALRGAIKRLRYKIEQLSDADAEDLNAAEIERTAKAISYSL